MTDSIFFTLMFLLPIVGMMALLVLPQRIKVFTHFLLVVLIAAVSSVPALQVISGHPVLSVSYSHFVFGNVRFQMDRLSAWFILVINLTCFTSALYGLGYMRVYEQSKAALSMFRIVFLLFHSSMLLVCVVQHGLVFLVVWELMSITSFLLVIFDHQRKITLQAGILYLVQMHMGVLFLAAAFIWVYFAEGSFAFDALENFFYSHSNVGLFLLFFAGFGMKAGFIPLHTWLPVAHPAAPSPVSGVMSGVMVKLGIYGLLRIIFFMKQDYIVTGAIVIILSVFTGLYGVLNAAVHRDYKKMLAYCTIENIGIIGTGVGLGLMGLGTGNTLMLLLGFSGALLHVLNHSLFKSLLFFAAGSVYQQTHTQDMEKLGGLIHRMPYTALCFLAGALAIGGLPPFNGFVSEFLLYSGMILGIKSIGVTYIFLMISALAALAWMGGLSMLTFTKSFGTIFTGQPRTVIHSQPQEVSLLMRLPQYFIIILMLSIGLFPKFYFTVVQGIVAGYMPGISGGGRNEVPAALLSSLTSIGTYSLLFILLLLLILYIRGMITRKLPVRQGITWGCGYLYGTPAMQYTGKSFSKSLGKLLNFILIEKKKYREFRESEIFPSARKYASQYNDFFLSRILNVIVDRFLYSLNYFQFIQNGKTQLYILYGIFFIVLIFLGTIFNVL